MLESCNKQDTLLREELFAAVQGIVMEELMRVQTIRGGAWLMAVASILSSSIAFADEKATDFYFQQSQNRFISGVQNARTFGMGGSTMLTSSDANSTVNNPAGLGMMKQGDIALTYGNNTISGHDFAGNNVKEKSGSGQVFGAVPLGPVKDALPDYGNLGLGWYGTSGDWSPRTSDNYVDTSAYGVSAAYGRAIGTRTSIGYGLTYQKDQVKGFGSDGTQSVKYKYPSSSSFLHTVGLQYAATNDVKLASTLTFGHGSHDVKINDNKIDSTDQFSFGLGEALQYTMDKTILGAAIDYTYYDNSGVSTPVTIFGRDSKGHAMNIRLGVEQKLNNWFSVRGGYRYAANFNWDYTPDAYTADGSSIDGSAKYNAWTLGAGLSYPLGAGSMIKAIALDYGVEYRDVGNNDWQHLVSLSAPFDLCK